jgi:MoCo/4Fe-4S cofactor protein with predicted Tat translocation signal
MSETVQNELSKEMQKTTTDHQHDHDHDHDHQHDEIMAAKIAARPKVERDTRYWNSLEQWSQDPEFQKLAEQEFMSSPLKEEDGQDGWARREFLKLMGASLALASASCIRRPVQKIVPYNKLPEEVTLGEASYYSSTWFDGSEAFGLIVKTKEGRPIKVEGNPLHPANKGGLNARAQAHILSLYDPERIKGPKRLLQNKTRSNFDEVSTKWEDLDKAVSAQLKKGDAVVLTGAIASPSLRSVIKEFGQAFGAKHVTWEALGHEDLKEGQKLSYGEEVVPNYRFDRAKVIVSIDADFLGAWHSPVAFTKQFAAGRRDIEKMSKLVVFDSNFSLTGANADIRVRIKPSQQLDVVMALLNEIIVKKGQTRFAGDAKIKEMISAFAPRFEKLQVEKAVFAKLAEDLLANRGNTLVVAGGLPTQTAHSAYLQVAVNLLNSALGNDGQTVLAKNSGAGHASDTSALVQLIKDMKDKKVKTLIIYKSNPAYSLAANLGFAEAIKNVEMVVYAGDRVDETGRMADYIATDSHSLESWGDLETSDGVFAIQQPTIRSLYDTRSFGFSLMSWAFEAKVGSARLQGESYYDYVRDYWKNEVLPKVGGGKSFDAFWDAALQSGSVNADAADRTHAERTFKSEAFAGFKPVASEGLELVLYPSVAIGDGTLANVSWLQELPDPVTKVCWENYVSVSYDTAKKEKLEEGTIVELTVGTAKLELPVHIQPGLHDEVLAIAIGYGRTAGGKICNDVGVNVAPFVSAVGGTMVYSGQSVTMKKTTKSTRLANPQGHHTMEGRLIVAEATLQDYLKNKEAGTHKHKTWSIWSGHQYNGHKWGMTVDLNSCTGCSACSVACYSENNIAVVGKEYVIKGREMAWIRIDRYYTGNPSNPDGVVFQPMMCQHCDNAPCETVCPVLATVHSSEGLNEMVYNRCVGTRYCSNNCPYKVRRFNWFQYTKVIEKPLHMAYNPDVTVRQRGVMEKCTFCVQRIKDKKSAASLAGRKLKDGEIKTACEQSCPTDAITFGDLNDADSKVAKLYKAEPRAYALLEEFNAAPSVRYLTKIRNNDKVTEKNHKQGEH